MKKFFCLILTCIAFVSISQAQTQFGVKAGINAASVKVSDGEDFDGKAGLHVGGLAHIHINRNWAVQPELVYSAQGGKDGDAKLKLNYVNIPVLVQYMFNNGFRLQTGPQLGFLTTAKTEAGDIEVDVKDEIKSTDFSWSFGAGYLFTQHGIGIDARYNLGISNISDDSDFEAMNRVFQVGVFYQFGSKKR